jgi:hypothetical protein
VRQGQHNRRGRGRNNNRKGGHHNPLSRSFESNGPNERIRGTPSVIAEKYVSLAREAQSGGDPVLAENYLQHAEHYSRIIMAYREQFNQPGDGANGAGPRNRGMGEGEGFDDLGEEQDAIGGGEDGFVPLGAGPQPQLRQPGGGEQHGRPETRDQRQDQRGESRQDQRPDRSDRPERQDRPERPFRRDQRPRYAERGERQGFGEREPREPREPRGGEARAESQERSSDAETVAEPRRRDRFQQVHEQPEFLRRPVRRARSENGESGKSEPSGE